MASLTVALLGAGGLAVVPAVLGLRRWLFVVIVDGPSMEPSLHDGDRVLARRASLARVRPGDIVVLEQPDENMRWTRPPARRANRTVRLLIKRVAAIPGGRSPRHAAPALAEHPAEVVPPGHLVAFGDNYRYSFDSKQIGYFPAERLLGVVLRRMPS